MGTVVFQEDGPSRQVAVEGDDELEPAPLPCLDAIVARWKLGAKPFTKHIAIEKVRMSW